MHSECHQLPYPGFTHIWHLVWHSLLKTQKGLSPLWSLALKHKFTQCLYCFTLTRQHFWDILLHHIHKTKKQVHIFKIVQQSLKISVNLLLRQVRYILMKLFWLLHYKPRLPTRGRWFHNQHPTTAIQTPQIFCHMFQILVSRSTSACGPGEEGRTERSGASSDILTKRKRIKNRINCSRGLNLTWSVFHC